MATNYKNILLKDNQGNPLLPITLSYYVEYRDGKDVRSYLDSLGEAIDTEKSRVDGLVSGVNELGTYLLSYVKKPDYAYAVVFDNTTALTDLNPADGTTYVSTQQAIEAVDARITSVNTTLGGRLTTAEGDIDSLETAVTGLDTRLTSTESQLATATTRINNIYTEAGELNINADKVNYTGSTAAGTDTLTGNRANVQSAIDYLGEQIKSFNNTIEDVKESAGVTGLTGTHGVLVNGKSDSKEAGSVSISINVDGTKVKVDNNVVTVDDSALSIATSQLTGDIDGTRVKVMYTEEVEGETVTKSTTAQEFYNKTTEKLGAIENELDDVKSDSSITVTAGDSEEYAKVYTISQGGAAVGTINIPKDQFLSDVTYDTTTDPENPALVFTWNLTNDVNKGHQVSRIPISSFIDAITSEIADDVTELQTTISTIESNYITGVELDGVAGTVSDHVVSLTSKLQFVEGTSVDTVSDSFLALHGITVS